MWLMARGRKRVFGLFLSFGGGKSGGTDGVFEDRSEVWGGIVALVGSTGKIAVGDGFDVGVDLAVEHIDDASGISG